MRSSNGGEERWVAWKEKDGETKGLEGSLGSRSWGELLIMTPLPSSCPQALTTTSKPQAEPRDHGDHRGLLWVRVQTEREGSGAEEPRLPHLNESGWNKETENEGIWISQLRLFWLWSKWLWSYLTIQRPIWCLHFQHNIAAYDKVDLCITSNSSCKLYISFRVSRMISVT